MEYYQIREMQVKYKNFRKVKRVKLPTPDMVVEWFKDLQNEAVEKFITIYLNSASEVICFSADFQGGGSTCYIEPRVVMRNACIVNATAIIILHNHPSGNPGPSESDRRLTKEFIRAGEVLGVKVLDSLIIGLDGFTSLREEGEIIFG